MRATFAMLWSAIAAGLFIVGLLHALHASSAVRDSWWWELVCIAFGAWVGIIVGLVSSD